LTFDQLSPVRMQLTIRGYPRTTGFALHAAGFSGGFSSFFDYTSTRGTCVVTALDEPESAAAFLLEQLQD
jgi:hypothetical protein